MWELPHLLLPLRCRAYFRFWATATAAACGAAAAALLAARWRAALPGKARRWLVDGCEEDDYGASVTAGAGGTAPRSTAAAAPAAAEGEGAVDLEDLDAAVGGDGRPELLDTGKVVPHLRHSGPAVAACDEDAAQCDAHLPGRQKVHVMTFGCPHNQSDGEYMMGQLQGYGYTLVDSVDDCDVCVVNSCTVKTPTEAKGLNVVTKAQVAGKRVVLAGCVPSGDKKLAESLDDVSVLHVTQLDRIIDVVEEAAKGHTVKLLEKKQGLHSLSLPKVRRDKYSEVITINAGCLGNCTYCKTKLARGTVVSYPIEEIVEHARRVAAEGACHIELASEDMGAYGVDIGTNIVELLHRLSDALPPGVMLRTGMTNPPYILQHIDGVIEALKRPNVYAFMHIPVQSGSDAVLQAMKREYTSAEFSYLCDRLKEAIPDVFIMTDIICGFPAESAEDWDATMSLARKYKFNAIYMNKFYARANTPAARMKQLKPAIGKQRYKEITDFSMSYNRNQRLAGCEERVWFSGTITDHAQTVGRTKSFAKVVVPRDDALLGRSALVRFDETSQYHVAGKVVGDIV